MTHETTAEVSRLATAAGWIAAVCCVPYLALKVLWTFDIPVGIADETVLDDAGWVAANALMAVVQLIGLAFVLALTRPWARRLPAWLVLLPAWVGTGLLSLIVVGTALTAALAPATDGSASSDDLGGFEPWVFVLVYSTFAGQGIALAIAFGCHVRDRWGRLLRQRTQTILPRLIARLPGRPARDLTGPTTVLAGAAAALVVPLGYWAAGGSAGVPEDAADPRVMHATRALAVLVLAAGLLALAGRWGQRTRFWVPVALTWVGSGAAAAFDALRIVLTRVPSLMGADDYAWRAVDTLLTIQVLVGLAGAAVGTAAVVAAATAVTAATPTRRRSSQPAPTT